MFSAEGWLARVAVKKAIYGIAKGSTGVLAYSQAQSIQAKLGIHINPQEFQAGLTAFMLAGASMLHDYAKLKFPECKWL